MARINDKPPGWGEKGLSEFFDRARRNQHATFANHKAEVTVLEAIDAAFFRIGSNLLNPQDHLTPVFLYRSHSAYRAASASAMAGQTVESFVLLRSCLEFAAYGLHIDKVAGAGKKWFDRHNDAASRKAVNNAFRMNNVRPTVAKCDGRLGTVFDTLYERAIDFGGHPNERAIMGSLKIEKGGDRIDVQQIYLHADGPALRSAVKATAEIGLCALFVLQHVSAFTTRFQILGLREQLQALRKRVDGMFKGARR